MSRRPSGGAPGPALHEGRPTAGGCGTAGISPEQLSSCHHPETAILRHGETDLALVQDVHEPAPCPDVGSTYWIVPRASHPQSAVLRTKCGGAPTRLHKYHGHAKPLSSGGNTYLHTRCHSCLRQPLCVLTLLSAYYQILCTIATKRPIFLYQCGFGCLRCRSAIVIVDPLVPDMEVVPAGHDDADAELTPHTRWYMVYDAMKVSRVTPPRAGRREGDHRRSGRDSDERTGPLTLSRRSRSGEPA